jgi:hypothetical protein
MLQLLLVDSTLASPPHQTITLAQVPLAPFLGQWVEAYEKITYGHTKEEGASAKVGDLPQPGQCPTTPRRTGAL